MTSSWPEVTYEQYPWQSDLDTSGASRRAARRHQGPYLAAVPPVIAHLDPSLPTSVGALAEEASLEIGRFDAEMGGEIAPFSSVLLRSESAASSQIENLTASARAVAEAELGDGSRRNARLVVANTRAMQAALALSEALDADAILAMHRALMEESDPGSAGQWRQEQVWIGGSNLGPHAASFIPPHHTRVKEGIADLVAFIQRDDLPVLAQAAISHAQFETIHPFTDGNGRTGRALLHALLRNKGLTVNVTVPISAGLLTDTHSYFAALDAYRAGDTATLVSLVADASFAAVGNGRLLVTDLRELRAQWHQRIRARSDSRVWDVVDVVLRHPVVNAQLLADELGVGITNTYRYLEPLESAGVLVEFTDNRRHRIWRSDEALNVLDAFAVRAGRRSSSWQRL